MGKLNWDNVSLLVVDDNAFMRNLIVTTLRMLGIGNVRSEASATDAIETLGQGRQHPAATGLRSVDVVISDFVMADVDGALFLRWIRSSKQTPDRFVPFIMVSGAADREIVETSRDAGVSEFLAKPFSAQSLSERLLDVIRNPRQFVLAPGYFGPDRRRHHRPPRWHTGGEDGGEGEQDRRVTKASQIQVIHARSNIRTLRKDVRAIHFRPANRLLDKLGPKALRGQIDFDPLVIQAAEERIQDMVGDYTDWVKNYLDTISRVYVELSKRPDDPKQHIVTINQIAHELRGQGGIFGYPLITAFGKSLYEATLDTYSKVTNNRLKLIQAHIDALRVVFKKRVHGDGGKVGAELLKDIETAVKKYSEPSLIGNGPI